MIERITTHLSAELHGDTIQNGVYKIPQCNKETLLDLITNTPFKPDSLEFKLSNSTGNPKRELVISDDKTFRIEGEELLGDLGVSMSIEGKEKVAMVKNLLPRLLKSGYSLEELKMGQVRYSRLPLDTHTIVSHIEATYSRENNETLGIEVSALPRKSERKRLKAWLNSQKLAAY